MFGEIVASFIQDKLKEQYRGFALWLFWSEIVVATGAGVICLLAGLGSAEMAFFGMIFLWYAAVVYTRSVSYERKASKAAGRQLRPGIGPRIVAFFAVVPPAIGLPIAFVQAWMIGDAWFVLLICGLGGLAGLAGTFLLARGSWPDFVDT